MQITKENLLYPIGSDLTILEKLIFRLVYWCSILIYIEDFEKEK